MRKKTAIASAALIIMSLLAGCNMTVSVKPKEVSTPESDEKSVLTVFAAASLTETLEQIGKEYERENPGTKIIFNFDSSGTLKTQIEEGAECDIFISAAQKQMDQLADLTDTATRRDILENKVVLAVPEGNPKGITSFDDLVQRLKDKDVLLAMGNEDVPVGQYTQKIFEYYGLDENTLADEGLLTYGSNVKEVTTQVSEAAVDCGIVYSTDAYSAGLDAVDTATEEMCGRVTYPAAVLKQTKCPKEAGLFLDELSSDSSCAVFESVGFTCLK
ncbi:MAG: molybdate ABC transporter substrate-binding protein [Lachnospiraceae bacterium]|nr:molybdate ABC transporter substrate-binding protein [Lachnospiraceae bacterium]